ncbi:MAG TPA: c-type cytochrome, partial [Pirellulaceae bacterium]|nr:c-type cytochrome [Pirellulaceae bacterium]
KVSDPKQEGRDEVEVRSSTVIAGGRTLVLEIPDLKPAMQMSVEYVLRAVDGESLRNTVTFTLNRVSDEKFDESRFARRERRGQLPMEVVERLRPGLAVRTTQDSHDDFHVARMASLLVADGRRPTLRTSAGRFSTTMSGFVHVDLRSEFQFSLTGRGVAKLLLNGQTVLESTGDLSQAKPGSAVLSRGYNAFRLEYVGERDAAVRVWWSSPDFAREPIPATALFHDSGDLQLRESLAWREGFWKYDELRCAACHESRQSDQAAKSTKSNGQAAGGGGERRGADPDGAARVDSARVDAATSPLAGPELSGIGQRTNRDWIAQWLLDPTAHRESATMPKLLDPQRPGDRQTAVDIAAWLSTLQASAGSATARTQETPTTVAL